MNAPDAEAARLAAIAAGDDEAFAHWLRDAEPRIRGSLRRFCRHVDVEAVLQETLLRAWQVAPRVEVDGRGESLLRVAIRMGTRLALDEVRRARVSDHVLEQLQATEVADMEAPDPLLQSAIQDCRDQLPAQPRRALDARLASEGAQRDRDLAQASKMSENTYHKNLSRARSLLKRCLEKMGVTLEEVHG